MMRNINPDCRADIFGGARDERGALLLVGSRGLVTLVAALNSIILPFILGADVFGEYSYCLSIFFIFFLALDFGSVEAQSRFFPKYLKESPGEIIPLLKYLFIPKLPVLTGIFIIGVFLIDNPAYLFLVPASAVCSFLGFTAATFFYCRRQFGLYGLYSLTRVIFRLIGVSLGAMVKPGTGAIYGLFAGEFSLMLITVFMTLPGIPPSMKKPLRLNSYLREFSYGFYAYLTTFLKQLFDYLPMVMLKLFGTDYISIGMTAVLLQLTGHAIREIIFSFTSAFFPTQVILYEQNNIQLLSKSFRNVLRISLTASLWLFTAAIHLGPLILPLLSEAWNPSFRLVAAFALAALFFALSAVYQSILDVFAESRAKFRIEFIAFILFLMTSTAIVPFWGIAGIALGLDAGGLALLLLTMRHALRLINIESHRAMYSRSFFALIPLATSIALVWNRHAWAISTISMTAGTGLYILMLFKFKLMSMEDFRILQTAFGMKPGGENENT